MLILLSSCKTKNFDYRQLLPLMPVAGKEVAKEIDQVCDDEKCKNFHRWINELYLFKIEYETIRLSKTIQL